MNISARLGRLRTTAPVGWLRRLGVGERVVKTAVAAGLAWELARHLPDTPRPFLAPLVAILSIQITVAESVRGAGQRILGVIVGVVVAVALTQATGVHAWSVGLLVLLSLAIGSRLRLGAQGVPQVAISALLVMVVGTGPRVGFAFSRVLETVVGAAVGVGVNALLVPPSHLPQVRTAVDALVERLADVVDELGEALGTGLTADAAQRVLERARATEEELRATGDAVERAEASLRFNPFGGQERGRVEEWAGAVRQLERVDLQVRGVARTLRDVLGGGALPAWLPPEVLGADLGRVLTAIAGALRRYPSAIDGTGSAEFRAALALAGARRADAVGAAGARVAASGAGGWVELGAVLSDLGRIVADLGGEDGSGDGETVGRGAATLAGGVGEIDSGWWRVLCARSRPGLKRLAWMSAGHAGENWRSGAASGAAGGPPVARRDRRRRRDSARVR